MEAKKKIKQVRQVKQVKCIDKSCSVEKINKMAEIAQKIMKNAYVPYSKYRVGACAEAEDGTLFGGCNVENAAYGVTLCAECTAISALIAAGKKRIKSLLVAGSGNKLCTPCGRCRQLIREFASLDTPIYLCDKKFKLQETVTLEQLLPKSFGPEHLI